MEVDVEVEWSGVPVGKVQSRSVALRRVDIDVFRTT